MKASIAFFLWPWSPFSFRPLLTLPAHRFLSATGSCSTKRATSIVRTWSDSIGAKLEKFVSKTPPLEIGPAINTAKSEFGGGTQMPHHTDAMMVKYLGRTRTAAFTAMNHENFYPLKNFDPIALDRKLPLVETIDKRCFGSEPSIVKVKAGFHDSLKRIMVVNSDVTVAEDTIPRNFLYAQVIGQNKDASSKADGCLAYAGR